MGGDDPWPLRATLWRGALVLALLVVGLGSWAALTRLSGAVVAPAEVELEETRHAVQHETGGVVEDLLVAEGDLVEDGQVLLRLDGSGLRSDLALTEARLHELAARRARLEAQRDAADAPTFPPALLAAAGRSPEVAAMVAGQSGLFARQAEALAQASAQRREQISQIESQIAGLDAQHAAARAELDLVEELLLTQQDLQRQGLAENARILALRREAAGLRGRLGALDSARAAAMGQIAGIDIEITALATRLRESAEAELADVMAREGELAEQARALGDRIARLDLRAPTGGRVFGLQVAGPGAVVRPAEDLMLIVPQGRALVVAARVTARHVRAVRPGQPVRLVFPAAADLAVPEVTGHVTQVSAATFRDQATGESFFRVEISLPASWDIGMAGLAPGLPLRAYILTAERSPLAYLLDPFADYFRDAFRDG